MFSYDDYDDEGNDFCNNNKNTKYLKIIEQYINVERCLDKTWKNGDDFVQSNLLTWSD